MKAYGEGTIGSGPGWRVWRTTWVLVALSLPPVLASCNGIGSGEIQAS